MARRNVIRTGNFTCDFMLEVSKELFVCGELYGWRLFFCCSRCHLDNRLECSFDCGFVCCDPTK